LSLLPLLVVLGACIGSFLNVVVYRLPRGLSLWHPPSHCPHCQTRLRPWDNVPVFGWLWLRGRCRYCGAGISPRYPLVETAMAVWFALAGWRFASGFPLLGALILGSWLLTLALIDGDTLTLPDGLLKSGLVLGLLWQGTEGWSGVVGGITGMVVGIWLLDIVGFLASVMLGQTALGGGDPKLAALLGAWLHWRLLLVALFIAVLTGAGAGMLGRITGRLTPGQPMPFGPFLALGGGVALLFGTDLLNWYLAGFA
jgi:leader peptidase (prepilin peptidase)/N-methyltransferase